MSTPLGRSVLLCLFVLGLLATCGPVRKDPQKNGEGCNDAAECISGHCVEGYCSQCEADSDCGDGNKCGRYPRVVGPPGGPYCVSRDAGCASAPDKCPEGFSCTGCDAGAGYSCQDTTGQCYTFNTPAPQCGQHDESRGFDSGYGPPPSLNGTACYTCVGCPRGSSCVCGASGLVGGLRCDNVGTALACFATGGAGTCRIYPGDCNTNAQCADAGTDKLCNKDGRCVQCLRDADCPSLADGGETGCIQGKCYGCCTSDSQCPASGPTCVKGFCYACSSYDGGRCGTPASDGGSDAGSDGGSDAGSDGGSDAGSDGGSDGGADGGDGG